MQLHSFTSERTLILGNAVRLIRTQENESAFFDAYSARLSVTNGDVWRIQ